MFGHDSFNSNASRLLAGGALWEIDRQDSIFHGGFDILRLNDTHQSTTILERARGNPQTHLGTVWNLDAPGKPPGPPLMNQISMFVFLGGLRDLPRNDEVPVLHVYVDLVLGQARKFERGCHEVLVRILV